MSDKLARVCDYCGKSDILSDHADSNGMVVTIGENSSFVLMRVLKETDVCRPSFPLNGTAWCPECLIRALQEWVKKNE